MKKARLSIVLLTAILSSAVHGLQTTFDYVLTEGNASHSGQLSYSASSPIETYLLDAWASGNRDCFTVEVPKGKTATVEVTNRGGSWSVMRCSAYIYLSKGKNDCLIKDKRTLTFTSTGKFSVRITTAPKGYWSGFGWQSSFHLYTSATAKFSYGVKVTYSGNTVPDAPKPAVVVTKSDLLPFVPRGWSSPLTLSKTKKGTSSKAATFKDTDVIYVNWAMKCAGRDTGTTFETCLYVDGKRTQTWRTEGGLKADYYISTTDYEIGKLAPGTHTIKIATDATGAVAESDETNNSYTRTVIIEEDMRQYIMPVTVTYLAGGGTGTMKPVTKNIDVSKLASSYKLASCSFKCSGYVFDGWELIYDACGAYEENPVYPAGYEYKEFCGDLMFRATWKEDVLDVSFDEETAGLVLEAGGGFCIPLEVTSTTAPKITVKGLPKNVKYNASTFCIEGVATEPGAHAITISATSATIKTPVVRTLVLNFANIESEYLPGLDPDLDAYRLMAGVNVDDLLDLHAVGGYSVTSVKGLPAGLKYDSRSGEVSGVPTKDGVYNVTITAKNGTRTTSATVTIRVDALPRWAQGTFTGRIERQVEHVDEFGEPSSHDDYDMATATVSTDGKISGKITDGDKNWTFSAKSFDAMKHPVIMTFDDDLQPYEYEDESVTILVADVTAKSGRLARRYRVEISQLQSAQEGMENGIFIGYDVDDDEGDDAVPDATMYRNLCKDKQLAREVKASLKALAGIYNVALEGGYLSVNVSEKGEVKATGRLFDGTSISVTSPLLNDSDITTDTGGWFFYIHSAPASYKGGKFSTRVYVDEEGLNSLEGVWYSNSPTAGSEYGAGFVRDVWFPYASRYDKSVSLGGLFSSAQVSLSELPELAAVYKETYYDDDAGKKQTDSSLTFVPAADFTLPGLLVNAKGTAFDIPKATRPQQGEEDGEWLYVGENDGAFSLSVNQSTGIVKGSITFWFDYESAYDGTRDVSTFAHTSKKVSFEGVVVQDGADSVIACFLPWEMTGEYEDERTGATKRYNYKIPFSVYVMPE